MEILERKKIFFTSDNHFGHRNIISYCNRPFKTVGEMNKTMVENWNMKVSKSDTIYVLGDLIWDKSYKDILWELNGEIIYVASLDYSHERIAFANKKRFKKIVHILALELKNISITLCHYCLRNWPKSHFNSWHLFGHTHGRLEPIGKSWDVGVDNNSFFPLSLEEIERIMSHRPDNPDLIRERKSCGK